MKNKKIFDAMNLFEYYKQEIYKIVYNNFPAAKNINLNALGFTVETPKDENHGELATNIALVLAKPLGASPLSIAQSISEYLSTHRDIKSSQIAAPGFVNFCLHSQVWQEHMRHILRLGIDYGKTHLGNKRKVNVEYVSVNPTGPMHAGHARGAIIGDVLANLLSWHDFEVCKEFYLNDAGTQAQQLGRSLFWRYQQILLDPALPCPPDCYPGEYLIPVATELVKLYQDKWLNCSETEWMPFMREYGVKAMISLIKTDLHDLNIFHDVFFSEQSLDLVNEKSGLTSTEEILKILQDKGYIYEGILDVPKGKVLDDWEPRPQLLFRSTAFGDDNDRPLRKSDGSWTYFARDIAYHYNKFQRGYETQINILGADHGGYIKRIQASLTALTEGRGSLQIKIAQMVRFIVTNDNNSDKTAQKMSKRSGNFIALADVIKKVGKDAIRFMMISRKENAMLDFDFAKVIEQNKDNPVFYIQYAYARICSVMKQANSTEAADERSGEKLDEKHSERSTAKNTDYGWAPITLKQLSHANFSLLNDDHEIKIMRYLASWPRISWLAAQTYEPHRITLYLYELAGLFHAWWNLGREATHMRFILAQDYHTTLSRLALIQAIAYVLRSGMEGVIGIYLPEKM